MAAPVDTPPEAIAADAGARTDEAVWLRSFVDRQQVAIEQQAVSFRRARATSPVRPD